MDRKYIINTVIGRVEVLEKAGKIASLSLPKRMRPQRVPGPGRTALAVMLQKYFSGEKVGFSLPLDLSAGTPWQQKIWRQLMKIPYGGTITYKDIDRALRLGRAYRAVGQACKRNPLPVIIPCHRVLGSNGNLGGYSSGLKWKKYFLALEKSGMR